MTDATKATLEALRPLIRDRRFDEACDLLRNARNSARAMGNTADESFLTSMLVSHLSTAGRDDEAIEESLNAEAAYPQDQRLRMLSIRQLLRAGRKQEAAQRCEQMLAEDEHRSDDERHTLLASLGECVVDDDLDLARQRLQEALAIAVAADLEPMLWNRTLALKLWRRGDALGTEYFDRLRSAAQRMADEATLVELDGFMR